MTRLVPPFVAAVAAAGLVLLTGCSTGDGSDLDARTPAITVPPTTVADTSATPAAPATTQDASGVASADADPTPATSDAGPPTSVAVAETGVPGLDSEDAFCAAWSRFGGSFQVVAVTAAFTDGPPESVAELEVIAAPTVSDAYRALTDTWPDEIDAERDVALDEVLGPFARRLGAGLDALAAAGATDDDLAVLDEAWIAALARRNPDSPEIALDLPAQQWALVDTAVPAYLDAVGTWRDDDSLVTGIDIPLTNDYLARTCPDQGALTGQEVG